MLIGVLGLGSIGQRHAYNIQALGHKVIVHDPAHLSSSRSEVIKQADAVIICTPTKQHANDLLDVLEARKHVLVEKPIGYDCPSFIAALIMGAKSQKKDLVVATGFMLRFHPKVQIIKKRLDNGHFGPIKSATFRVLQYNDRPEYLRDGVIKNWASHEIDLARYLLGNLEVERCHTFKGEKQEIAAVIKMFSIEDGADVEIEADYVTRPEIREFEVIGRKNSIKVNLVMPDKGWDQVYLNEMDAFLNAIDGKDPGPLADGCDGVAALQLVMDAREKAGLKDG